MAVQFIVGPSGTGKTKYIYEKMISESMKPEHPPIIFILPEQANMGAEKDMISYHPNGGTMDISIVSFTRLAFQVFDKDNVYTADILDDYGKSMLVMKVLKEHADELLYYGNIIDKQGFVDEVKSILSEFYQYQITTERLEEIIVGLSKDNSLYYKLSDILIIMINFEKAMGNTYMVAEQMLTLLAEHIEDSDVLENAIVYFDGFTGYTPVQYKVIEKLMVKCSNLYFTITMDEDAFQDNSYDELGLYRMGKDIISKLSVIANDNGVSISPHIALTENHRFKTDGELSHLEKNIFRFPVQKYNNASLINDEIEVIEFDNIEDEILCIGRRIHALVREEGYRFRDVAIITGDLDENNDIWERVMKQLEIPFFIDLNEQLVHNQIVEVIHMLFDMFEKDFTYDTVFSFLKTDVTSISMNEIYELENYVFKHGVRGYSWWKRSFQSNTKGLAHINKTRQAFMELINDLYPVFSMENSSATTYIKALYDFLSKLEYGKRLWNQSITFDEEGDVRQARVYRKAYEKLLNVMDKTIDLVGDERVSRRTLADMLTTGMSDMKLGILPSTLDQVLIGDMERTRLHHAKILFVAGANEGVLPKTAGGGGIITDGDRNRLKEMNVSISPGNIENYYIRQFYLYMQLTCVSDKLVISYRKKDSKYNSLNPSFFVKHIIQMFPDKRIRTGRDMLDEMLPFSKDDMFYELSKELSEEMFEDPSLILLMSEIDGENVDKLISGYLYMNQPGLLNAAIAKKLYGANMKHTVSRLESFASCQYQFFLRYGLRLRKLEEYKVKSNNIGTILHAVMEDFFKELKDMGTDYSKESLEEHNVTGEYINKRIEELTAKAADDFDDTIFASSYRMKNQLNVITRIAIRSANNLLRHLEMGEMTPEYFEKEFSPKDGIDYIHMVLKDDLTMDMSGIIDRVDIKETDDAIYVKVIDYKSGNKDIDFIEIAEGRQLQLAVYLSVMLELLEKKYPDKRIIPSGMYYYQLSDKLIDGWDDEKLEKNRIKESRLSGLVTNNDKCLEYMDHKTGEVVPVSYKDGKLSDKNPHVVTEEEIHAISEFTRNKMIELGMNIIRGQIDMRPRKGNASPCNLCDFRSVCRFETGLGGNAYAAGSKYDKEQAKDMIFNS